MLVGNKPKRKTPKLSLGSVEKRLLRRAGVNVMDLPRFGASELSLLTGIPLGRCKKLLALSTFQELRSVGPSAAEDLWALGYSSIEALRGADPVGMYERLNRMAGKRLDPCVEDVLRCAVAQAICPDLPQPYMDWWVWRNQRGQHYVRLPEPLE